MQYIIEIYDNKKHNTKEFTCGVELLDKYLKERATQEIKKSVAAVYIIRQSKSDQVAGYYSLSSYTVELSNLPETTVKKLPKYRALPAILIGRLAVDINFQGKKIGEHIIIDALKRSFALSQQLGSYAVVVDSKNEKSRSFYERYGFLRTLKYPFTLYLPMGTIKVLFE